MLHRNHKGYTLTRDNYAIVLIVAAHGSRVGVDLTPTDATDTFVRMVSDWQLEIDRNRLRAVSDMLDIDLDPRKIPGNNGKRENKEN